MHILLSYDHWTNKAVQRLSVPYIRILGFDEKGRTLLKKMKTEAKLPVLSRFKTLQSPYCETIMAIEYRATELWEMLCSSPVSYTHLDVYKRQSISLSQSSITRKCLFPL